MESGRLFKIATGQSAFCRVFDDDYRRAMVGVFHLGQNISVF